MVLSSQVCGFFIGKSQNFMSTHINDFTVVRKMKPAVDMKSQIVTM